MARRSTGSTTRTLGIGALAGTILASMPLVASGLNELSNDIARSDRGIDMAGTLVIAFTIAIAVAAGFYFLSTLLYRFAEQGRSHSTAPLAFAFRRACSMKSRERG